MAFYRVSALEIRPDDLPEILGGRGKGARLVEHLSGDGNPIGYEGSRPANHPNIVQFESHEAARIIL